MPLYNRFEYFLYTHLEVDTQKIHQTISDNAQLSATYLFLLICATILSTLGLLLNSPAVIIGSMVISPLTWPILRVAYGIATAEYSSFFKGVRLLIISIVIMLGVSFLLTKALPLTTLTDQITSRIAPTILDLIIALIAGAIASLALTNKKISQTGAGVAIAASLLPPMCVGGIGLAFGIPDVVFGGILLSLTNIIAILFIATVILVSLIKTYQEVIPIRRIGVLTIGVLLIIISIPLLIFFSEYVEKVEQPDEHTRVENILTQALNGSFVQMIQISPDTITAVVLVPNGTYIPPTLRQDAQTQLTLRLRKTFKLNLHLVQEIPITAQ